MSLYINAGFLVGIGLFILAIAVNTDNPILFLSVSSCLLVVGGTFANAFLSFQGRYVLLALRETGRMFTHARINQDIYLAESRRVIE